MVPKAFFIRCRSLRTEGIGKISRLPVSIRIVLESVLRNFDGGKRVSEAHVRALASWGPTDDPLRRDTVCRRPCHFAGFYRAFRCLSILRRCVRRSDVWAKTPASSSRWFRSIWSSITRCRSITPAARAAYQRNMEMEFKRNDQRYRFLKWGTQAFNGFQRRTAGHRHRPSGKSRVSGKRRV